MLSEDTVSCDRLIQFLANAGDFAADESSNCQRMIVAESLMRSYEVKRFLAVEFRKSKNGINWVANSDQEIDENTYMEMVDVFNQAATDFGDLRFVNTTLKMLDLKCAGLAPAEDQRHRSIEIAELLANA